MLKKAVCTGLIALYATICINAADSNYKKAYCWAKSLTTFHISLGYNYVTQGPCSFNNILAPHAYDVPTVLVGPENSILCLHDGKEAPIYLSNIPQSQDHFAQLRRAANLNPDSRIALHTLNRGFEQKFVWLGTLVANDQHITQYQYSTTDFTTPSLIDLIRGVYNLDMRDENKEEVACVHCKAGKGRSATLVIAYGLYVYHIAIKMTPEGEIVDAAKDPQTVVKSMINYVKTQRSVIDINAPSQDMLTLFYTELTKAGNLDQLRAQYKEAINARDNEFKMQN